MRINLTKLIHGALFLALAFLSACGGGGGGDAAPATTYTIGGIVSGLTGTGLVLQNNGGGDLPVSANGNFAFVTPQANSSTYTVTVQTQPSGQICTVNSASGTVSGANVTTVTVTCAASTNTFTIGGTVTGLTGAGLVLQNNGGDNRSISANGNFVFATPLANGSTYTVTVQTQPSGQTCTVTSASGTVSGANVTTVAVACAASTSAFTIGGTVTGLTGAGLVLQNNGGDNLPIATNGSFVFATSQLNGTIYQVTVQTQPTGQTCTVTPNIAVVFAANVTTVVVTCSAITYTIGGSISGLTATGLVLQNNGGDNRSIGSGASVFTFATAIASSAGYSVTVLTQPTGLTCTVSAPSGTVAAANVTSVSVACSVSTYSIGGTISGLTGSGLVLQNNGGDNLTAAPGGYAFATKLAHGSTYNVTVLTQPTSPAQICTVANASGTATAAVTNANVSCVNAYTIRGTITGAADGIGPILQNNGGDNLFIPAITTTGTSFAFSTPVADGASYSVTQLTRARAPSQNCSAITNGSGTVSGGDVTSVTITCVLSTIVPRFAYVTNSTANPILGAADTVSAFTIAAGGDLAAATTPTTATGDEPYAVAVDPTGQFAYVVNRSADSVSVYGVDPVDGFLTVIDADGATTSTQASIATGDIPISIAIHPSGMFAYVANQGNGSTTGNTLSAYGIDITSGALTAIDADAATPLTQSTIATGAYPYAVTVDPTGKFAYVANYTGNDVSSYTINQTSGALTPVGTPVAAGTGPSSIAIDPTGKCALVANNTSDDVKSYTINQTTGALTLVNTVTGAVGSAPRSIAIDPNTGLYAYVANAGAVVPSSVGSVSAYSITLSTCTIAPVNADAVTPALTIAAGTAPISVNVDPSGQFVYVANLGSDNVSVYRIGAGGALTWVQTLLNGAGPTSVTTTQ